VRELTKLVREESIPVDQYLKRRQEVARSLSDMHEDIVDVAYDHEDPLLAIEALEIIALDREPKCEVVLRDLMLAHPDPNVQSCARRLLLNVTVLATAKAYLDER
jgi:hypothetical protein